MNLVVCETPHEIARAASNWCEARIKDLDVKSIFIPAGATPIDLYGLWEKEAPAYLRGLDLLQIDEVVTGKKRGIFFDFFKTYLPSFLPQIRPITKADDHGDLAILGLGLNGHVAFHEPGLPGGMLSACVRLSPTTCKTLELEPDAWGLTYGTGSFLRAKSILMIVKGSSKKEILKQLRAPAASVRNGGQVPATFLLDHPDFTIIADRAACDS